MSSSPGVPPCDNCQRLRFDCYFRSKRGANDPDDDPRAKPESRRVSKACVRCREHKIRCTGAVPCATCLKKSALCEYTSPPSESKADSVQSDDASTVESDRGQSSKAARTSLEDTAPARATAGASSATGTASGSSSANSQDQSLSNEPSSIPVLLEIFFQHVYPLPSYTFLHPATIRRRFADGTIDKCLLNAIAAVSSVRAPGTRRCPSLESSWVQESETLIWQHLESPSIPRLQAMLLVILYRAETGQLRRAFMLASLAGRAAMAMRLNHERPGSSAMSLEVRRRLLWSLKLVERYFSVGLPEFELCPVENIYIQLPCVEYEFSGEPGAWEAADDRGSYHISVKLEMFRRDVMKLNRSLMLCDAPFPQLPKLMNDFQQHLYRIGDQLPDGPEPSEAQLETWLHSRWLPRYLIMRLSFHQIQTDLYRLLLRNFRDAAPRVVVDALDVEFLDRAETLCIRHAKMSVRTIAALDNLKEDPPRLLEFDTAICAYTASRILLFTARFGSTPERPSEEFALSRAEQCLAAVQRFFPRSMLVKPIIAELRRLIDVFAANEAPSSYSSPKPSAASLVRDPTTQLSSAARIRQRLAIHSLLRQANFVDEDDEPEDTDKPAAVGSDADMNEAPPVLSPPTQSLSQAPATPSTGSYYTPPIPGMGYAVSHHHHQLHHRHRANGSNVSGLTDGSPASQCDSEPWAQWFCDFEDGKVGDGAVDTPQGLPLAQRSFNFPWLQREDADLVPQNVSS